MLILQSITINCLLLSIANIVGWIAVNNIDNNYYYQLSLDSNKDIQLAFWFTVIALTHFMIWAFFFIKRES